MQTVRDLLKNKAAGVVSVAPDTIVFDALKLMAEKDIGAVLVLQENQLVGIFSERDYARKVTLLGKNSKELKISDIMTAKVLTVESNCPIEECMQIMTSKRIRHVPVYENSELAGVVSVGDVIKAVIEGKEHLITQLEHYIIGGSFSS